MYNDNFDELITSFSGGRDSDLEHLFADMSGRDDQYADRFWEYVYREETKKAPKDPNEDNGLVPVVELLLNQTNNLIKSFYESEDYISDAQFVRCLLTIGIRFARSRYAKLEKVDTTYKRIINNKNYVNMVCRDFLMNNKIHWDKSKYDALNSIVCEITNNTNMISYQKVAVIKDFILNNLDANNITAARTGVFSFRELLSAIRFYFLHNEIKYFNKILQKTGLDCFKDIYTKLYGKKNIDILSKEFTNQNFNKHSTSMVYFYPRFTRELIEKALLGFLTDDDKKLENIEKLCTDYFIVINQFVNNLKNGKTIGCEDASADATEANSDQQSEEQQAKSERKYSFRCSTPDIDDYD
ncbi:MAG: hypothetical protein IJ523_11510 [Succinivibrionaceae bacterium]|nr:hypothetical protein [Succinivibrionaceae bacterium]